MEALLTIGSKVLVMLILILVGYIVSKKGMFSQQTAGELTTLLLRIVLPCLIVSAFIEFGSSVSLSEMGLSAALTGASMGISLSASRFFFRKDIEKRTKVLQFSALFGNMGFMGVPLVQAIVGEQGVIYASFAIVVFNLFSWTYGYRLMNSKAKMNIKTILFNPGMIGILIGLPICLFKIQIPSVVVDPINFLASVNTPLAMIVIGSYVAKLEMKSFVSDMAVYRASALRLILMPILTLGLLLLIRPKEDLFMVVLIQAAMPVAANTVLFAAQYKKDVELATKIVAVSTLLSILTIPIFVILGKWLLVLFGS